MIRPSKKDLRVLICMFAVVVSSIFLFQYAFGGQAPFSKKVIYFSSPDSKAAFEKISFLNSLEIKIRLQAFGDPTINLLQNIFSLLPKSIFSNPGYLFILNAIIHSFCGFLVFINMRSKFSPKASWTGSSIFILNPTHLEWTANLLKDGIFIFGCLLLIFSISKIVEKPYISLQKKNIDFLFWLFGLLLIYKSRIYFLEIFGLFGLLVLGIIVLKYLRPSSVPQLHKEWKSAVVNFVAFGLLLFVIPICLGLFGKKYSRQDSQYLPASIVACPSESSSSQTESKLLSINDIKWKSSEMIPDSIEKKIFVLSVRRQGFLNSAGYSKVDDRIKIQSTLEFMCYLPKALLNGWFSPFPNSWFQKGSSEVHAMGRRILGFLSLFYWPLILAGALYFWENRKQRPTLLLCGISLVGVLFFAFVIPNIGALNRMRYGFYMLWIAFGAAYMTDFLLQKKN